MEFKELKKRFGFGCMRLCMKDGEVDYSVFNEMIDAFLSAGFHYFDTAHGYIDGKSELAIGACLSARYPRDAYLLTNKLSEWYLEKEEDILPYFENQLKACRVEYFDFYLLHSLNRTNYEKYKAIRAFENVKALKDQGKLRHMGISFHDTADVLDRILTEQPHIEVVQLQINYLDYDDPGIQSRACYDVAVKHGKKVIVMEPVKGGTLVNLPREAAEVLDRLGGGSYASYALRYAADHPEVIMVLSGMGSMDMMRDNIGSMSDPAPLTAEERKATDQVRAIIRRVNQIGCTACNYCAEVCPQKIPISGIFAAYNRYVAAEITRGEARNALPTEGGKAADCIGCGACEGVCPQSITIRDHLATVAKRLK